MVFCSEILQFYHLLLLTDDQMSRGSTDIKENYHGSMVSEDEAVRLVKMVLPYFNELLLNLRRFFSGDPATTMKVAAFLSTTLFLTYHTLISDRTLN